MVVLASIKAYIARQLSEASAINGTATREIAAKSVASRRAKAEAADREASWLDQRARNEPKSNTDVASCRVPPASSWVTK
jgi:hypothetical protein